ncbi:MAG TPA: PLP-dependent aminotransferase family protein [Acidimicrobiia bacterium]|nr:PLP-dependent aminotransferase family protein [Acidimicrobiia bacterium]
MALPASAADIVGLLGDWSARGSGSLAARLAFAFRSRILADLLPAGTVLPPERPLAEALAVSRSTLVAALDLLRSEGLVSSRQGSGTRVAGPGDFLRPVGAARGAGGGGAAAGAGVAGGRVAGGGGGAAGGGGPAPTMAGRLLGAAERGINFGISAPPAASGLPALAVTSTDLLAAVPAHGYDPAGLTVLRAALAERHSVLGLSTIPEEIHVTHGAQHAIDLALATLCRPGDAVAVEDPTYPGVLDVLAARALRPVALAADARGPTPAGLEAAARSAGARVAFLLPAVHNPTGRVLDGGRRQALARMADRLDLTVVEDNTLADLAYEDTGAAGGSLRAGPKAGGSARRAGPEAGGATGGAAPRPPSLARLCRRATVVSVETTSKVAWGGLRVGWLRAPAAVIERSVRQRTSGDLGCSVPAQLLALQLLGHYDDLIAARRPALRASAARLGVLVTGALPGCAFDPPAGGLSLWVRLPGGADAAAFASRALRHGVSVAPGTFASPAGGRDHLRLCHDRPEEELVEGAARLAAAWADTIPARVLA